MRDPEAGRYVYMSVRVGARVTSRYLGRGEAARRRRDELREPTAAARQLLALEREQRRQASQERRQRRDAFLQLRATAEEVEAAVRALASEARAAAAGAMAQAGYHLHRRSEWRRRRGEPMSIAAKPTPDAGVTPPTARSATPGQLARQSVGPVARATLEQLLDKFSPDPIAREHAIREFARVLQSLLEGGDSPIERLLSERAAICWIDCYTADRLALHLDTSLVFSPAEREYFQRTRDRAHRRFLATLAALDNLRARALPTRLALAVQDGRAVAVVESHA